MTLYEMTLSGAIIILIIVVVRALGINKLPKKAFLALWAVALVRLLVPFSIESALSVNNLLPALPEAQAMASPLVPISQWHGITPALPTEQMPAIPETQLSANPLAGISIQTLVWLLGMAALAVYFMVTHLRARKNFSCALPVQNQFTTNWLAQNRLRRSIRIHVSDRTTTPFTYGVLHPVIVLPKSLNLQDEKQLLFILTHELVHIRRLDALIKPVLAAALCLHWFNPLVWVMFILANRDLELSCDENVIQKLGSPDSYARTLLELQSRYHSHMPLISTFSRFAIQERIVSIMKYKKTTVVTIIIAIVLVTCVATAFATSPLSTEPVDTAVEENTDENVYTYTDAIEVSYTSDDSITDQAAIQTLLAAQRDGFESMKINEFTQHYNQIAKDDADFLKALESLYMNTQYAPYDDSILRDLNIHDNTFLRALLYSTYRITSPQTEYGYNTIPYFTTLYITGPDSFIEDLTYTKKDGQHEYEVSEGNSWNITIDGRYADIDAMTVSEYVAMEQKQDLLKNEAYTYVNNQIKSGVPVDSFIDVPVPELEDLCKKYSDDRISLRNAQITTYGFAISTSIGEESADNFGVMY